MEMRQNGTLNKGTTGLMSTSSLINTWECAILPIGQVFFGTLLIFFNCLKAKRRSDVSRVVPEEIDPFLCTHINFAFAKVGENLDVKPYEEDDTASWTGGPGMYHRINALRQNNSDLKIMLSIGGWVNFFIFSY